ncbi:MAG TPA: hypothetical protein VF669_17745 [Tepidisphaeraceae bacterium]|jgi:uncharacterized membrane protein YciS (DUF1049 family)
MDNLWLKIKFWTKLTITVLVVVYIAFFIGKNSDRSTEFWYWYNRDYRISILVLAASSFIAGAFSAILVRTTLKTLSQFRSIRGRHRTERLEREISDMKAKAAMLQTKSPTTQPIPPSDRA